MAKQSLKNLSATRLTGWYPYPFLDITKLGYGKVLVNIAVILLVAFLPAVALKVLDRWLPGKHAA